MFCKELELVMYTCSYSFITFYLYLILIYITVCTLAIATLAIAALAISVAQETRIPSEMCAGETCITGGKHASLVICVWGNTHP